MDVSDRVDIFWKKNEWKILNSRKVTDFSISSKKSDFSKSSKKLFFFEFAIYPGGPPLKRLELRLAAPVAG